MHACGCVIAPYFARQLKTRGERVWAVGGRDADTPYAYAEHPTRDGAIAAWRKERYRRLVEAREKRERAEDGTDEHKRELEQVKHEGPWQTDTVLPPGHCERCGQLASLDVRRDPDTGAKVHVCIGCHTFPREKRKAWVRWDAGRMIVIDDPHAAREATTRSEASAEAHAIRRAVAALESLPPEHAHAALATLFGDTVPSALTSVPEHVAPWRVGQRVRRTPHRESQAVPAGSVGTIVSAGLDLVIVQWDHHGYQNDYLADDDRIEAMHAGR